MRILHFKTKDKQDMIEFNNNIKKYVEKYGCDRYTAYDEYGEYAYRITVDFIRQNKDRFQHYDWADIFQGLFYQYEREDGIEEIIQEFRDYLDKINLHADFVWAEDFVLIKSWNYKKYYDSYRKRKAFVRKMNKKII